MMLGGGMMLGIGLLMMFIFIGLPILLIGGLIAGLWGLTSRRAGPASALPMPMMNVAPARYCAHCGQGLQADWAHCPKCGSPVTG